MAEALARHLKGERESRPLVVGIMGSGHVRNGYGVAHQLRDLGVTGIAAFLPLDADTPCSEIKTALADAVFALPAAPREKPAPPRLGVQLEMRDKNVAIAVVTPASLAEQSGIRAGDVVVSVAGAPVSSMASVTAAVREQPAGTWLPIQVRRGESTIDLTIKFPRRYERAAARASARSRSCARLAALRRAGTIRGPASYRTRGRPRSSRAPSCCRR